MLTSVAVWWLFGVASLAVVVWWLRGRAKGARRAPQAASKPSFPVSLARKAADAPVQAVTPRSYKTKNVGNDASARPWETQAAAFAPEQASSPGEGSSLLAAQTPSGNAVPQTPWGVPGDFDVETFLQASKANFTRLQDAWDHGDMSSLRAMMTDGMLDQIKTQLQERERFSGGQVNKTDVVMLNAQLLGIEELDGCFLASVEFSGLIREDVSAGPNLFREIWNITRLKEGAEGWLVSGVQALQ